MYLVVVAKSAWHAIGRRVGSLMGLGELLGLLLAVPVASCIKTFFDAWAQQRELA